MVPAPTSPDAGAATAHAGSPRDAVASTAGVHPSRRPTRRQRNRRGDRRRGRRKRRSLSKSTRCLTLLTQNVRGLAKTDEVIQNWLTGFKALHKGRRVDAVFLQETRAHRDWAQKLTAAHARSWGYEPDRLPHALSHWSSPTRPAGGVAILFHPQSAVTNVQPLWQDAWTAEFMAVTGVYEGSPISLINVYASSASKVLRDQLFDRLRLLTPPPGLVIVGGDFNCTLDRELDRSRLSSTPETDRLELLLATWSLADAATEFQLAVSTDAEKRQFHAEFHTYRYATSSGALASSRLDRWYISPDALGRLENLAVTPPVARSDHDAVWLTLREPHPPQAQGRPAGRRVIRYPLQPEELQLVRRVAESHIARLQAGFPGQDAQERAARWDDFKPATSKESMSVLRDRRRRIVRSYRQRKRRLRAALRTAQTAPGDVSETVAGITRAMAELSLDRHARWRGLRDELITASEDHSMHARRRMFSQYAGTGADASRALHRRIALRFHAPPPARLPHTGVGPYDPSKRMAQDWRCVTQRGALDPEFQDHFFAGLPAPRAFADPDPLVSPFTADEVAAALAACPRGKACGPDGLPNDWYKDNADLLVPVLTELFNEWYSEGVLPASFGEATIYCIPKKPNPRTGLDYRPIALLNTDYKIFSRLLLARTSPQLHRLVSPSQFGFVPGRQVHDAIDVWTALSRLVATGRAPASTTAILLDFAKAYDTLDRRFLTLALRRLKFPDQYIRAVEAMHLATTASYMADGHLSQEEPILNGIRQGCPLAPVLFILAVDVLYDQLAASTALSGVKLPTGESIMVAGFADDTTVYLATPDQAVHLRAELDSFARASGLAINVDKCQALALSQGGWPPTLGDIGFPKLDADQPARLLGSQIGSNVSSVFVWDLAVKQIRTRLAVAQMKTSDVLQRVQIAQSVIVPKVLFIGRHCWPSASQIRDLQRLLHNFVWHGRFVASWPGRAWLNTDAASLSRRDGGIAMPDLHTAFLQLATTTHLRWNARGAGLQSAIGMIMGSRPSGALPSARPSRSQGHEPRLQPTLEATGAKFTTQLVTQPRTAVEHHLSRHLLSQVGRGTSSTRWWGGHWLFADYSADRSQLLELRQHQTDQHGSFDFHALMRSSVCRDDILHDVHGLPVTPRDFPGLVHANDTIGDLVEIQWVRPSVVRFRCRTHAFPLSPTVARSFRRLCDTIVYNYPSVLAPHDPVDVVRVNPPTIDSWRLSPTDENSYSLIWEPSNGIQIDLGAVRSVPAVTAKVRHALDDPTARACDHEWLSPPRAIWRHLRDPVSKGAIKSRARAAKATRGKRETAAREGKLAEEDPEIGAALASIRWADIDRLPATTSAQRLRLRRIKGNRLSGWDRLHEQHGCPHCADHKAGGRISHIFWDCVEAQALWTALLDGWAAHDMWAKDQPVLDQLKLAAFGLQLPRVPASLWQLPELTVLGADDVDSIASIHEAVEIAWQQQVLEVLGVIWKWRHNITDGVQHWRRVDAIAYLRATLRSSLCGLTDRLRPSSTLRDPRRRVLRALAAGFDEDAASPTSRSPSTACDDRHVLFFDGGSRGNPGPGGAGAVLVTTDRDGMHPRVVWSSCMSYCQDDMTNNRAEYHGVIAGLQEAYNRRWQVEVVGDSRLILDQLAHYRAPRHPSLRPLYTLARRLADLVKVDVWQHHPRAYNKMADAAANIAMDARTSIQAPHPSGRPHASVIEAFMASDLQEWRVRRLLRLAMD